MSLYAEHEICDGCKNATFFDCGRCLKACAADAQRYRDHRSGKCPSYVRKELPRA